MAAPYTKQPLSDTFWGIVDPWMFMYQAVTHLPSTIVSLPMTPSSALTVLSPSRLQPLWFANFWALMGPQVREASSPRVIPLLQGLVADGTALPPSSPLASPGIAGTVLEIGAGSGMWVHLFSPSHPHADTVRPGNGQRGKIVRVLGVEPNTGVHPALRKEISTAGLDDTYEIVPMGIQDALASGRIAEKSVDCIVTVLCLCSIPDGKANIAELYRCLKPGGRWYVYEHVAAFREQGWAMRLYQAFVNIFWPRCIGGCNIRRDTLSHLREAGAWASFDLVQPRQEPWFFTLPHIYGILTK